MMFHKISPEHLAPTASISSSPILPSTSSPSNQLLFAILNDSSSNSTNNYEQRTNSFKKRNIQEGGSSSSSSSVSSSSIHYNPYIVPPMRNKYDLRSTAPVLYDLLSEESDIIDNKTDFNNDYSNSSILSNSSYNAFPLLTPFDQLSMAYFTEFINQNYIPNVLKTFPMQTYTENTKIIIPQTTSSVEVIIINNFLLILLLIISSLLLFFSFLKF